MPYDDLDGLSAHLSLLEVTDILVTRPTAVALAARGVKTRPLFLWNNETRAACPDDMTLERFRYLVREGSARLEMAVTNPDGSVEHLPVVNELHKDP